jgi:hypothetical protein
MAVSVQRCPPAVLYPRGKDRRYPLDSVLPRALLISPIFFLSVGQGGREVCAENTIGLRLYIHTYVPNGDVIITSARLVRGGEGCSAVVRVLGAENLH